MRFAETETPELSSHGQTLLRGLAFVDSQKSRTGVAAQEIGDRLIRGGQALLTIHNHQRDRGLLKGKSGLLSNFRQEFTVVIEDKSSRVNDLELTITPVAVLVGAITGHPRLIMNNRLATATETIDQRGLANVGAANDRDNRTRQGNRPRNL